MNKAKQFITKTLEITQELLCLESLQGQIVMQVSFDLSTSFLFQLHAYITAFVGG